MIIDIIIAGHIVKDITYNMYNNFERQDCLGGMRKKVEAKCKKELEYYN